VISLNNPCRAHYPQKETKTISAEIDSSDTMFVLDSGNVYTPGSEIVSVTSTENNTKIKDIHVGSGPGPIGINGATNTVCT
jgi:hypothetical protein